MSNSSLPLGSGNGSSISYRKARPQDLPVAAGLILADGRWPAGAGQIADFLNNAADRGIDLSQVWVAEMGEKMVWATLGYCSPGRTLLLISPVHIPDASIAGGLIEAACGYYRSRDVHLAQALVSPDAKPLRNLYVDHRFIEVAELIYLQTTVPQSARPPAIEPGLCWQTYSQQTHALFASTIQQSYQQSMDCPALSGLRDMEDVILGHKATGEFNPNLWHLLCRGSTALGVLLLAGIPRSDMIELVYLGLTPEARGHGFGELLMRQAEVVVVRENRLRLNLAVDSKNVPAQRLYFRHGMHRTTSRLALIRDLRQDR